MEDKVDIRWKQRFQNLRKAFAQLEKAVGVVGADRDDELKMAGLIQFYEFTYELAWKTLKDLLTEDGFAVNSPRETIRMAFAHGYISNAELWLQALNDRNLTTHTYDEDMVRDVVCDIITRYYPMISQTVKELEARL